jgi:VCBS repeat-containing protein
MTSSVPADAGSVAGNALANDSDPDAADTLTVSAITGGTLGAPLAGTYGSLTLNADGSYSFAQCHHRGGVGGGSTATDTFTTRFQTAMAAPAARASPSP